MPVGDVVRIYTYEEAFEDSLKYFNNDELAAKVFLDKYALRNKEDQLLESNPDQMHWRIAKEIARVEKNKFKTPLTEDEVYSYFKGFNKLIAQGSPMYGIGNKFQFVTLSNCYVEDSPLDSYGDIHRADEELSHISKRRGGVGLDLSNLRPSGFSTQNSSRSSTGVCSFAERYSNSIREVGQAGRRGALMLTLSVHHPEILDFIRLKKDKSKVTGANLSIRLSDEFLAALKNGDDYELRFPVNSTNPTYVKKISSKEVWNELISCAHEMAEPGALFWDTILRESPADCYAPLFTTVSTNPCSELPLSPYDSCRLLVLNVFSYVLNPFTKQAKFDFDKFKEDAKIAQRFMDDIVDLELECINRIINKIKADPESDEIKSRELSLWKKIKKSCELGRRTGTGITAIGDAIAALGMKYGSDKSIEFVEEVYKTLKLGCYWSSVEMAKELGAFEVWDHNKEKNNDFLLRIKHDDLDLWNEMKKYGRRNIALLTTAPVGSVSILTQTSAGIEPLFMLYFDRNKKINPSDKNVRIDFKDPTGDCWQTFRVYHPKIKMWTEVTGEADINKSPWVGCCADDLNWKKRVELQAVAQKHVDHAISSTLNLPEDVSVEKVKEIYETAWKLGCKGITIYRKGCRTGVLIDPNSNKEKIVKTKAPKRPDSLPCDIFHFTVEGKEFVVLIGLVGHDPYEVFGCKNGKFSKAIKHGSIVKIKRGHYKIVTEDGELFINDTADMLTDNQEAICRLVSTSLRHGADVSFIVEQLEKVNGNISSFAKSIARALKKYIKDGTRVSEDCPNCNKSSLVRASGCIQCSECGWSKCV